LRGIEHADEVGRDLRLAGAAALHLGLAGKLGLNAAERSLRIAASSADQAGSGALLVVEERFQQVLGRDPLMEVPDRDGLADCRKPRARSVNFSMSIIMSLILGDCPDPTPTQAEGSRL
jgi:hypothetical protein